MQKKENIIVQTFLDTMLKRYYNMSYKGMEVIPMDNDEEATVIEELKTIDINGLQGYAGCNINKILLWGIHKGVTVDNTEEEYEILLKSFLEELQTKKGFNKNSLWFKKAKQFYGHLFLNYAPKFLTDNNKDGKSEK